MESVGGLRWRVSEGYDGECRRVRMESVEGVRLRVGVYESVRGI